MSFCYEPRSTLLFREVTVCKVQNQDVKNRSKVKTDVVQCKKHWKQEKKREAAGLFDLILNQFIEAETERH